MPIVSLDGPRFSALAWLFKLQPGKQRERLAYYFIGRIRVERDPTDLTY